MLARRVAILHRADSVGAISCLRDHECYSRAGYAAIAPRI